MWGWRQPNHWRNAQNAPIVLSDDTPKPAARWLYDYVRKIAPVIRADQRFTVTTPTRPRSATVAAEDWASAMGRPELRTFTWRITDGGDGRFAIVPATGELRVAQPSRLDEHSTYPLKVRVSDGFHESEEVTVSVATGDLANIADTTAGGTVPATLSLSLGDRASFAPFTPGVARDYEASLGATVTSTAGEASLSVADPVLATAGRLVNGAFTLAQPLQAATDGAFAPDRRDPANPAHLQRPGQQRPGHDPAQAGDRRDRGAAHRRLRQDADVHRVDDGAVSAKEESTMHPRARAGRRRRVVALAATALAGAAMAPAAAHAQFPVYSKDKWLGSISEFTRPLFTQYFNQITPENGGKWGVAAGTTRTAAMRWNQLDQAVHRRPGQRLPVQLPRPAVGQPATDVDGDAATGGAARRDQEVVRGGRRPLPGDIKWLQVVNEPTWDPPDGSVPKNAGHQLRLQRQLRAGARRRQRHRRHGL